MNKKLCRGLTVCLFFLCIWIGLIYFEKRPASRPPSVYVRRSSDYTDDLQHILNQTGPNFDPNLPNLRKKVLRLLQSTNFNRSAFENPFALYTQLRRNDVSSLTVEDVLSLGVRGRLTLYRWNDFCSVGMNMLKSVPGFPFNPYTKSTLSNLNTQLTGKNFGLRIFGYLLPPVSGVYSFSVASSSSLELWLSLSSDPSRAKLIASVCDGKVSPGEDCPLPREDRSTSALLSDTLHLSAEEPCYVEILSVYAENDSRIEVKWRKPESDIYQDILSKYFVSYAKEHNSVIPETYHPSPLPIHRVLRSPQPTSWDVIFKYPKLPFTVFSGSIPKCYLSNEIKNSLTNKFTVPYLSVYPDDKSGIKNSDESSPGNLIIPKREANFITDSFLEQIRPSIPKLSLHKLVNIEKYQHQHPVTRYLIEMLVHTESKSSELFAISETFFSVSFPSVNFCQHTAFKREETPFVHFVFSVKNNAHWTRDLVENLETIREATSDERFSLVIVDFQSSDIDTEVLLQQSKLRHWMLIEVEGNLLRSAGINLALDLIRNPNDIIFTLDLALGLPLNILDQIRKRTFQGYSAYAPVILHQMCGHSYMDSVGYWDVLSYSLVGMYTSDWVAVGGMNSVDDRWRGEDWRCVGKILENGINLNRIKERNFYRHLHSKVLWD